MNIELSDEQYKGIEAVAKSMGIPVTELILRGVKSCTLVLDLFPEDKKQESIPEEIEEKPSLYNIKVDGKVIETDKASQALYSFVDLVTPRKIYVAQVTEGREDNLTALVQKDKKGDRQSAYKEITDKDNSKWFIYKSFSSGSILNLIESTCKKMEISFEKVIWGNIEETL
jgi:tRNA-binding EMAP/Myf-like protein